MPPEIRVEEQPRLSPAKLLDLTFTGIRYRLFRSFMTVVVIAVAVAFMMNTVVERMVSARVGAVIETIESDLLQVERLVARIGQPPSLRRVVTDLAEPGMRPERLAELQAFSGLDAESLNRLREDARRMDRLIRFLEGLDYGLRREMVGAVITPMALAPLAGQEARKSFFQTLDADRSVRLPMERENLDDLFDRLPAILDDLNQLREARSAAVRQLKQLLGGRPVLDLIAGPAADWLGRIESVGFRVPAGEAAALAEQALRTQLILAVEQAIQRTEIRQAISRKFNLEPVKVNPGRVWPRLVDASNAAWFVDTVRRLTDPPPAWAVEDLQAAAEARQEIFRINTVRDALVEVGDGPLGLTARTAFLLLVSVMVCVVGITNAMLMSVTERYREIATLKCLGALDGSILWIFVFEAALLGLVGALAGALIGGLIGTLTSLFSFGGYVLQANLLPGLLTTGVAAILGGTLLAAVASIYPSLKAARLAPMEAMRIE
ncbi:MAG: ABC transporter permease [Opitutales bacterium]